MYRHFRASAGNISITSILDKPPYSSSSKHSILRKNTIKSLFIALFFIGFFSVIASSFVPTPVNASFFSFVAGLFNAQSSSTETVTPNSQNMTLLKAAINSDPNPIKADYDLTIVDDTSLLSEVGPSGLISTSSQAQVFDNNQITTYVVRSGDTLPQVAQAYGISVDTIKIANDLMSSKLTTGQRLIILPVSGIQHTVKSGETLQSIANKYKVTISDIREYNNLESSNILAGDFIFVPSDKLPTVAPKTGSGLTSGHRITSSEPILAAPLIGGSGGTTLVSTAGFFIEPVASYTKTQGLHGHNGVDLAAPKGTPIMAAANGEVVISRMGWNGGYGNYIVIQHSNGTQTLYGHMSKLLVSEGDTVTQGQTIGLMGSTGASTGSHLHVEVRGGVNPF